MSFCPGTGERSKTKTRKLPDFTYPRPSPDAYVKVVGASD
jgi:hypothetical protein